MPDDVTTGLLDALVTAEGYTDVLDFPHNHSDVAWSHFLAQHIGKTNTENFVRAFYLPLNELDNALNGLYTLRWLETAEGAQLDGIGSIVGIGRTVPNAVYIPYFGFASQIAGRAFGVARIRHKREPYAQSSILGDTEYRVIIHLKIALNNGHGTAEEIIYAFNSALGVTKTRVQDVGNANARVYINDFIMSYDPRSELLNYMIPKAAGVKLWPYYVDADYIFGFSNQNMGYYGFDIGIFARSPPSNIPPIVIHMSIWDRSESVYDSGNSIWDLKGTEGAPEMTSAIDVTKPVYGNPTTQSVRDNFDAAYNEITDLQSKTAQAPYLPIAGGQMDGMISLRSDAVNPLELVTKRYVDNLAFGPSGGIAEAPNDGFSYARTQVSGGMAWVKNPRFQNVTIDNGFKFDLYDTTNTSGFKMFVQGDDNLVLTGTKIDGTDRVIAAMYMRSDTSSFTFLAPLISANLTAQNILTISGSKPELDLVSSAVADEYIYFKTNALKRWAIGADAAQTGFGIYNYDVSGNVIGKTFSISKDVPVNKGMTIDAHGNIGFGGIIPPTDENSANNTIHINGIEIINWWGNCYYATTNYKYIRTGYAVLQQISGGNSWAWMIGVDANGIAKSGNAGDQITFGNRMALTADGELRVFSNNNSEPLNLISAGNCRIFYSAGATSRWSAGALPTGEFYISDESVPAGRLTIGTNGSIYAANNIQIHGLQGINWSAFDTYYHAISMDTTGWALNYWMSGGSQGWLLRSFPSGNYTPYHRTMLDGASQTMAIWFSVDASGFAYWSFSWSDRKFKSNIKPAEDNAIDMINKLNVVNTDIRNPLVKDRDIIDHWDYALIADEVQEVIPIAYVKPPETFYEGKPYESYASIRELPLICLLIKANQEMSKRLTALEDKS